MELALSNAMEALKAHSTLVDFKDDPDYELEPWWFINVLDEEGRLWMSLKSVRCLHWTTWIQRR